jgi:hypothetical protein
VNASLIKRVTLTERFNVELRADATNLTNTPTWDFPTASITSATFGRLNTPNSLNSRKVPACREIQLLTTGTTP